MTNNPIINVPIIQRPAIQELAKMTSDSYEALRRGLAEGQVHSEPAILIEKVSKQAEPYTMLGGQIISVAVGLRSLVDRGNMALRDIAAGVAADGVAKKYIEPNAQGLLFDRLVDLLETRSIALTSKAYALAVADASPFSDVRIVSDIRPIFTGPDDRLEFSGSVVVHHLVIEVTSDDKDQYSTLSTSDLLKLKRTVERALEKDRRLRDALKSSEMAPLEPSSGSQEN